MALSDESRARYARQILLPELGLPGQERIVAGCAAIASEGGLPRGSSEVDEMAREMAHQVAVRYALRAGFGRVSAGALDMDVLAPRELVSHDAPRAALAGARAALAAIRRAAGIH